MKNLILLFIAVCLFSCSKDDEKPAPVYQEENFFDGFIVNTGFGGSIEPKLTSTDFELGTVFIPTVKGKITSLNVKLPLANNALKVKIWDKLTLIPIRTEIIIVPSANTITNVDIPDLELTKDKEYAITINTQNYYLRTKTSGTTNVVYPVILGNVKIMTSVISSGALNETFPSLSFTNKFFGDVSFNFQRTE